MNYDDIRKNNILERSKIFPTFDYDVESKNPTQSLAEIRGILNQIIDTMQNGFQLDGTNEEVFQARNNFKNLKERLSYMDNALIKNIHDTLDKMNRIKYNLSDFTQNKNESFADFFTRVLNEIGDNATLFVPNGTYDFGSINFPITKQVTIEGESQKGVIMKNVCFAVQCDNVNLRYFTIDSPNVNDGVHAHDCSIKNLLCEYITAKPKTHGFLFESYEGSVENCYVYRCVAQNCIHGFVSKAIGTKVIECRAVNISSFGFAMCSDNIPDATKYGQAWINTFKDNYAYNCGYGFRSYARDKFNTECKASLKNNIIDGLICNNCTIGVMIGEDKIPSGYLSTSSPQGIIISNISKMGSYTTFLKLTNLVNCQLNNIPLNNQNEIDYNSFDENTKRSISQLPLSLSKTYIQTSSNQVKLDVNNYNYFEVCCVSSALPIMWEGSPVNGQEITVMVRTTETSDQTFTGFSTASFVQPENMGFTPKTKYNRTKKDCCLIKFIYTTTSNMFIPIMLTNGVYSKDGVN